jgi:hypothetical protein
MKTQRERETKKNEIFTRVKFARENCSIVVIILLENKNNNNHNIISHFMHSICHIRFRRPNIFLFEILIFNFRKKKCMHIKFIIFISHFIYCILSLLHTFATKKNIKYIHQRFKIYSPI